MNLQWFVIRSSHAIRFFSRGNAPKALCGKWGTPASTILDEMPAGKSCESCLRIVGKQADLDSPV